MMTVGQHDDAYLAGMWAIKDIADHMPDTEGLERAIKNYTMLEILKELKANNSFKSNHLKTLEEKDYEADLVKLAAACGWTMTEKHEES